MGVRDLSQPLRTGQRRGYGMSLTVVFLSVIYLSVLSARHLGNSASHHLGPRVLGPVIFWSR